MSKFGLTLSAAVCAALFALSPAQAGQCGPARCGNAAAAHPAPAHTSVWRHDANIGRAAGRPGFMVWGHHHPHVNFFAGGSSYAAQRPVANVFVYGGGGSYVRTAIPADHVEAIEGVSVMRGTGHWRRSVDAVCVSRDGHDMPAARVRRAAALDGSSEQELFRCEAGFVLRAIAAGSGRAARATEIVCDKGMSLWSGAGGEIHCRDKAALDRSEAQLRHAFGTGAIMVTSRRSTDDETVIVTRGMSLDGGVGYAPY